MKSLNMRKFSIAALVAFSVFSYVFLHDEAVEKTGHCPSALVGLTQDVQKTQQSEDSELGLPDVVLVKRILNITKIITSRD